MTIKSRRQAEPVVVDEGRDGLEDSCPHRLCEWGAFHSDRSGCGNVVQEPHKRSGHGSCEQEQQLIERFVRSEYWRLARQRREQREALIAQARTQGNGCTGANYRLTREKP